MNANHKKTKGALINYGCSICNIEDNFTESFSEKVSKIKSKSCKHFDFKFIYNPEKGSMKYMISFICKNCGKDNIVDLYQSNPDGASSIHYQCIKCQNGDMNFQMILNEEALKEQNKNIKYNSMNNINLNNNRINNNINSFNFNQMNNFNQSFNNIGVIGGNMNQNNMMQFNNFNNNFMMNNLNMNQNFQNNNFPMFNSFNNRNMNIGCNNQNFMMRNMNLNNMNNINNMNKINNNINNEQNVNKQNQNQNPIQNDNNSIKLTFKDTTGLDYFVVVSSLDLVFSEVACKLLEENKSLDESKVRGFLCNGGPVKDHKTLKENNIDSSKIITIYLNN